MQETRGWSDNPPIDDRHAMGDEISPEGFREAMAHLGASVSIITTDGRSGRAGFTGSAVCSVTDQPPTVLVCLNRKASVYEAFRDNGVFCVNVLADDHQEAARLFGGRTATDDRFASASWSVLKTGAPVMNGAIVSLDCEIRDAARVGTHDVFFGKIREFVIRPESKGLIYFRRRFHALA